MKVSRTWLQRYFATPLPSVDVLAEALTFHAFEIESVEGDVLDVKVLPDRAGYALSHRGIAKEVSAILSLPLKRDPLREVPDTLPSTDQLQVTIDDRFVIRHIAALVEGVRVGPSPKWLQDALESVGQRSINNIVDATNFVMLDIGQPMHAFDADYIRKGAHVASIDIRKATPGESVTTLSGDTYPLAEDMYVISNGKTSEALDIAGVKGGLQSGVQPTTNNIILSVGTYDGELVRKTCQRLSIHTDASQRYQNRPSPELGAYGMRDIVALIVEVAGGSLRGGVDIYAAPPMERQVSVTAKKVSRVLGAEYSDNDIEAVLTRLDLSFRKDGPLFTVTPPFERTDIVITEDLVEEVGRIIGYDRVIPALLPTGTPTKLPPYFSLVETIRDIAVAAGCIEISTYSMGTSGDIALQKPLAADKKYLRSSLVDGHTQALTANAAHMPLYNLADLRLFEVGRVWRKGEEVAVLGISYWSPAKDHAKKRDAFFASIAAELHAATGVVFQGVVEKNTWQVDIPYDPTVSPKEAVDLPESNLVAFKPFSSYPYALRDIAVWTPEGTNPEAVHALIQQTAGDMLVRSDLHDVFTKDGRTSCMFKLVLQAFDRTLTDTELATTMARITDALNAQTGFSVR